MVQTRESQVSFHRFVFIRRCCSSFYNLNLHLDLFLFRLMTNLFRNGIPLILLRATERGLLVGGLIFSQYNKFILRMAEDPYEKQSLSILNIHLILKYYSKYFLTKLQLFSREMINVVYILLRYFWK